MIDRSMRACLAPGPGAARYPMRARATRKGAPLSYKEKGGRDLSAREVIRLTIVVYTPRRHDYHANHGRVKVYAAFLSLSGTRVQRGPAEDDAPSRCGLRFRVRFLNTHLITYLYAHLLNTYLITSNRKSPRIYYLRYSINASQQTIIIVYLSRK